MSNPVTHKVISGDTLFSLAKKYGLTVAELKSINNLTSDTIKVGQVLKLSTTSINPNQSTLKLPMIIFKSKNNMGGADSKHSYNQKLPAYFLDTNSNLYKKSKHELHQMLLELMTKAPDIMSKILVMYKVTANASEQTDRILLENFEKDLAFLKSLSSKNNAIAKDFANQFVNNTEYSEKNSYSNAGSIELIRNSAEFKKYISIVTTEIKNELNKNGFKLTENMVNYPRAFHFQGVDKKSNYFNSLIITIDQISYVEVELNDVIYKDNKPNKLKTTFILHDTYGLDMEDLKKFGALPSYEILSVLEQWDTLGEVINIRKNRTALQETFSVLLGNYFYAWWILQYYHGCIPLWVKLRVENVEIDLSA